MFFTPPHAHAYTRLLVRTQRVLLFRLHPSPRLRQALLVNGLGVKDFPKNELTRVHGLLLQFVSAVKQKAQKVKGEEAKPSPFTSCRTTRYAGWVKE